MNKPHYLSLIIAIVATTLFGGSRVWADPPSQVGRLSLLNGSVSFRSGSLDEWVNATLNYPLSTGDSLWIDGGARAELQLRSAAIRLGSQSEFSFLRLEDQTVQISILQGSLNVRLRAAAPGEIFEIDTPNAVVSLLAAGSYRVDVGANGQTSVAVREGDATVTAGGYERDLPAGQSTIVTGTDSISYSGMGNPPFDAWDSWCADRDRLAAQFASRAYVSVDMIGVGDLESNGTWAVTAGYGPTWAPSHLPEGWAPYRFGHWAWVEPWGWTWIDDAPWGFAPFHYGRWAYVGIRWLWIPGATNYRPVYAPALVVFVGGSGWSPAGGDGIGWFPLGPHEIYVPPYQTSVEYVRIINVTQVTNISVQVINNYDVNRATYANRSAPRAMTIVSRDAFARSRLIGAAAVNVSQADTERAPIMGMTAKVAPKRESVIARPESSPSAALRPPLALQNRTVISRNAAPPSRVPFAEQNKALAANPGRPVESAALSSLRQDSKPTAPLVRVVNASTNRPPTATTRPSASAPADQSASRAASLIASLRGQALPDADRRLADARRVQGIRFDFNSAAGRIAAARQSLSVADRDMSAKNYAKALQEVDAIQREIGNLIGQIETAIRSVSAPKDPPRETRNR